MQNLSWSTNEKRIARTVFERAAIVEEKEVLEHFKQRVAALQSIQDLWNLQDEIYNAERSYQHKYDFRYSQLIIVFSQLLREGRISFEDLEGLSEEKLSYIRLAASL